MCVCVREHVFGPVIVYLVIVHYLFLFSVLAFILRCIHLIRNLLYFSINKDNVSVLLFLSFHLNYFLINYLFL